jgi:hypothetical protein
MAVSLFDVLATNTTFVLFLIIQAKKITYVATLACGISG